MEFFFSFVSPLIRLFCCNYTQSALHFSSDGKLISDHKREMKAKKEAIKGDYHLPDILIQ